MSPKAPPNRLRQGIPKLLPDLLDHFLPTYLSYDQRVAEKDTIIEFVKDLNKVKYILMYLFALNNCKFLKF